MKSKMITLQKHITYEFYINEPKEHTSEASRLFLPAVLIDSDAIAHRASPDTILMWCYSKSGGHVDCRTCQIPDFVSFWPIFGRTKTETSS